MSNPLPDKDVEQDLKKLYAKGKEFRELAQAIQAKQQRRFLKASGCDLDDESDLDAYTVTSEKRPILLTLIRVALAESLASDAVETLKRALTVCFKP